MARPQPGKLKPSVAQRLAHSAHLDCQHKFSCYVREPTQVDLAPLAAQLDALRRTPPAQISPALDHLYALLGRPVDPAADTAAEALVAQALGRTA